MNCILCGSEDTVYQGDGNYICRRCHRSFNDLVYREPIDKSKFVDVTINNKSIPEISNEVSIDSFLEQENKVLKKALELICYYMEYQYWKKDDDIWYRKDKELYMYFIDQAKESLKDEKPF